MQQAHIARKKRHAKIAASRISYTLRVSEENHFSILLPENWEVHRDASIDPPDQATVSQEISKFESEYPALLQLPGSGLRFLIEKSI
jgi:hypothetical protein